MAALRGNLQLREFRRARKVAVLRDVVGGRPLYGLQFPRKFVWSLQTEVVRGEHSLRLWGGIDQHVRTYTRKR